MTETKNFKLKKPDLTDPVDVSVFSENFETIDENLGGSPYVVDLTEVLSIDFSDPEYKSVDLTNFVDADAILAAKAAGRTIAIKVLNAASGSIVELPMDGYLDGETNWWFISDTANPLTTSYSLFRLVISDASGSRNTTLYYTANPMKKVVKTVNGIAPDADGNVDVTEGTERPVAMDLSSYEAGTIRLTYADGGIMNVAVTFDADGNPIKFSNGTEEFTITWPAEKPAEEEAVNEAQ